jgi:hypothetical protein
VSELPPTRRVASARGLCLLAILLAGGFAGGIALAQKVSPPAPAAGPTKSARAPTGAQLTRFSRHESEYYRAVWGVDALSVKLAESGELIRFSWRVLDPGLAAVLSDKKAEPALEDPQAGVSLVVPTMENIGQLRQTQPPEAGRSYWMTFSNSGRPVKHGHRVNVVIGSFRANGLIVE